MTENTFVISEMNFVEIVHVELSNKGGESVVSVVARKNCLLELFLIEDSNAFFLAVP